MKTFRRSLYGRKGQREAYLRQCAKLARWRAAKAAKRLARAADEPPRPILAGRHCYTLTVHNRLTDTMHAVDLYVSDRRVNAYRVTVDGQPWQDSISLTRVLSAIRRKLPPFRRP